MEKFLNNALFWQKLDTIYLSSELVIDKPKGYVHPLYANLIYPVDYGYLKDTLSFNEGISTNRGTGNNGLQHLIITGDILKKDIEVKLLVNCVETEVREILTFLNQTDLQKAVLITRDNIIPSWGETD
ncbi:MAG: Inorganic pyrophosphatase [Erysipelothrix sp.]|nr:Inorganic pyrophosphatase [Erysipelothrix sp.]